MASTRPFCISCNRTYISWGKTTSGRKRYRCPQCGKSRKYQTNNATPGIFPFFRQYVLWGHTYEMLSSFSGYSLPYLVEKFHELLEKEPPDLPLLKQSDKEEAYLLIDGLWFSRWYVLMVYRQSGDLTILHISVAGREAASKIAKDLRKIIALGYRFTCILSDGGTGIVKAVNEVFAHVPHQICLAHLHRGIITALGRYPKDEKVKKLKVLADHVWKIESKEALSWWKNELNNWIKTNIWFLKEKRYDRDGNWWHIHKNVRRAVRTMLSLPETSFVFLDYPLLPKTTNELEAQLGHLGKRWLAHRGMKKERWNQFMKWFVYFYNEEKLSDRKTKEAENTNTKS